jgi:ABC-2 type transport system permease protein
VNDMLTVLRKELREVLGDRSSRRGGVVQSLVVTVMLGIVFPSQAPALWLAASPLASIYFGMLPALLAVTVAADAFAGERERKTLETLLATPLGERAILVGKAGAAITFAMTVSLFAFVIAVITVNVVGHPAALFLPSGSLIAGALLGALAASSLATGVAILLSMKVAVARSVQQMTSVSSMVLFGAVSLVWGALGLTMTWSNVLAVEGAVLLVALAVLEVARAAFRRDRFFEHR